MIDLLKNRVFGGLAASRFYPLGAQILTLAAFGALIAGGLAVPRVPAKTAGVLRNTNLAALVVWSLWWPMVIISASLLGRVWCQICPMELVNSLFSRTGLKSPLSRSWSRSGRAAYLIIATLYGAALMLVTALARFAF